MSRWWECQALVCLKVDAWWDEIDQSSWKRRSEHFKRSWIVFENISVFWTSNYSMQTCLKHTTMRYNLVWGLSIIYLLVSLYLSTYLLGKQQKDHRLHRLTWRVEQGIRNKSLKLHFTACCKRSWFNPLIIQLCWTFIHMLGQLPLHSWSILPFYLILLVTPLLFVKRTDTRNWKREQVSSFGPF